jgi:murein DD-endopeptidase MepM/ murein hydrolase activator NlpD
MRVTRFYYPVDGDSWESHVSNADLRGLDDGEPGELGWRYSRSVSHSHRGIDLPADVGSRAVAVEDGWAEYRVASHGGRRWGWNGGGNRVLLQGASGALYMYLHLGTSHEHSVDAFPPGVQDGDRVPVGAGDVVGYTGYTGGNLATGRRLHESAAHLHFQFHPEGLEEFDCNPVRFFELTTSPQSAALFRESAALSRRFFRPSPLPPGKIEADV